jgi:glucose/arabinose dehydrogenase
LNPTDRPKNGARTRAPYKTTLVALVVAEVLGLGALPAAAQVDLPDGFLDERVIAGFDVPVGMAFLPDGRLLVIEQFSAQVRTVIGNGVAMTDPSLTVPNVSIGGERGLLGIAVDPGWPKRPYIYIHATSSGSVIRISRFTGSGDIDFDGNGDLSFSAASRFDLITNIPDAASNHNGGTVRFGTDGMLYVSLGEDANTRAAQDTSTLRGVILRLDVSNLPDGPGTASRQQITPSDNPFSTTGGLNARLLWAWGLRNPFRFQVDAANGDLWIADVGQSRREEIDWCNNPGMNFGWPRWEGSLTHDDTSPLVGPAIPPVAELDRDATNARSIISGGVYHAPLGATRPWPSEYENSVFYSDYFAGVLRRLVNIGGDWSLANPVPGQPSNQNWGTGFGSVSDYAIGPEGSLYYCHQSGEIRRIVADTTSTPPPPPPAPIVEFASPYPSPSTGTVTLRFAISQVSRVRLVIYDMSGARIRTVLVDDAAVAGIHSPVWDGLDEDKRMAPSGLYFALLEVDGSTHSRRVPIVR